MRSVVWRVSAMARLFCWFVQHHAGSAAVEYGLIAFGIGLAIVVSIASLGSDSGVATVGNTFH
jgi:Flp pilus assembly pilin Flp